jgi:cysteine synthase A
MVEYSIETGGGAVLDKSLPPADKQWICDAIEKISADFTRSSDTHMIRVDCLCANGIDFYLKDESTHPTGSLKHRLARSLFLYGLCNGLIRKDTAIIEASSGSTAISEAYFARLLGLPFIAVVPEGTAAEKLAQIGFYGGECKKVKPAKIYQEAQALADSLNGHYMDQFTYAERATDWRRNNNIAESLFAQMQKEPHPIPSWIVVSAGTGGTSATIGRFIRYCPEYFAKTKLCVVDPENSIFFDFFKTGEHSLTNDTGSRIEGIGRPRVEPSFLPSVIDEMIRVPDAASIATIWWLEKVMGRKFGGSTGTNVFGALHIAERMAKRGETGSVVSMICDTGERYLDRYYNPTWIAAQGMDLLPYTEKLDTYLKR